MPGTTFTQTISPSRSRSMGTIQIAQVGTRTIIMTTGTVVGATLGSTNRITSAFSKGTIQIAQVGTRTQVFQNPTFGTVFVGKIIFTMLPELGVKRVIRILDVDLRPIIMSTRPGTVPIIFSTRPGTLPAIFHSIAPFLGSLSKSAGTIQMTTDKGTAVSLQQISPAMSRTTGTIQMNQTGTRTIGPTTTFDYSVA